MGSYSERQTVEEKITYYPVECANGHQVYVVYFPAINAYGFSCPTCRDMGVTIETKLDGKFAAILEVRVSSGPALLSRSSELLLFTEQKAETISCGKSHQIAVMICWGVDERQIFGFFDKHCKRWSREIEHRGRTLAIEKQSKPSVITIH